MGEDAMKDIMNEDQTIETVLAEVFNDDAADVPHIPGVVARARMNYGAAWLSIAGHGTCAGDEGEALVLLEMQYGRPVLHVWADVNQEDPTHRIDLSGAHESLRQQTDDQGMGRMATYTPEGGHWPRIELNHKKTDNFPKFTALLAALSRCGIEKQSDLMLDLCDALELPPRAIQEILLKARIEQDRISRGLHGPREVTPHKDIQAAQGAYNERLGDAFL